VATAENEAALLDVALAGTAAQVERFVRAWRRVDRATEARDDERRFLNRQLATWVDDDGIVVIRGRLTPEVGAVVQRALEAAADRLFRESRDCTTGDAFPATRRWSRCTTTPMATCCTWAAQPHDTAGDSSRARRPRPQLSLPRLHLAPLRCPSCGALG
jgi:hypothetical protein